MKNNKLDEKGNKKEGSLFEAGADLGVALEGFRKAFKVALAEDLKRVKRVFGYVTGNKHFRTGRTTRMIESAFLYAGSHNIVYIVMSTKQIAAQYEGRYKGEIEWSANHSKIEFITLDHPFFSGRDAVEILSNIGSFTGYDNGGRCVLFDHSLIEKHFGAAYAQMNRFNKEEKQTFNFWGLFNAKK